MKKRSLLAVFTLILFLTGCAGQETAEDAGTEREIQSTESATVSSEPLFHADRYTAEQKDYLCSLWGEDEWEKGGYNDSTAELSLLGSGYEMGHKTTGIARGFSYETENTDIPESSGNKKVSYETIEAWARKKKDFRLDDAVPYQHTLKSDTKSSKFHITFPLEEGNDYTFDILGHVEENMVCIEWMMVYLHEGGYSYTYSIYEHLNYIRSVLEEKKDWNQPVLNIMEGSVDNEGAYISLSITPDASDEYMMPEEGILDDTVPVHIMQYNGDSLNGKLQSAIQTHYVAWNALEHGEHELFVGLIAQDGSKKQVAVPFIY
ncbi:MAG: hypothetical protein NC489_32440 [Ruminococcus flavefaciens]|nr:hypothetical protein [Ruminococcus flavefaciens]